MRKILSVLLGAIIMISLAGCGKVELKNEWAKTYEEYLKKAIIDKDEASYLYWQNYQNYDISFIDTDEYNYPIMIAKLNNKAKDDEGDSCPHNLIYFNLDEDNKVQPGAICGNEVELKLLYDIKEEKYKYGLYYIKEDEEPTSSSAISIYFEDDNIENISYEEFKNKYIEIELNLVEKNIDNKITEKELLKTIQNLTEEEKINTVTEDNKKYVSEKLEEIKKQEEEQKKKEEEEKKKKGLQAGKYTLKYGYYKNMNTISDRGLDITINTDNTCTFQRAGEKLYGTDSCTYEIKKYEGREFDGSYVSGYHIIFHITGLKDIYFNVNKNNTFIDQSAVLVYQGEKNDNL